MDGFILLDGTSQVTKLKQKYYIGKSFIAKGDYYTQSSGIIETCRNSRCKIAVYNGNHALDEKSTSNIQCLVDVADSYRVTICASINDASHAHALKGGSRYRRTEYHTRSVNRHVSSDASSSE